VRQRTDAAAQAAYAEIQGSRCARACTIAQETIMLKTRSSLNTELTGAAQQALRAAGTALDDGRELAGEAVVKVGDTIRDLRNGASAAAARSAESLSDTAAAAQRRLHRYGRAATRSMSGQPVKTALIAAAVGAGLTALLLALARGRRRED
jgi:hypothetical protein